MRCLPLLSRVLLAGTAISALLSPGWLAWSQTPGISTTEAPLATPGAPASTMPPAPPQEDEQSAQSAVRLSEVEGTVRLSDNSGKLFDQALRNMAMLPGMTLDTGNDARAELEFPDGSVARITPNSALTLLRLAHDNAGRAQLTLKAVKGLTYYEFAAGGASFAVTVGPLTAILPMSSTQLAILRVNLDATPYQAGVLRGTVHFEDASGNATYDLEANQTAKIDPAAATNYDISLDLAPDSWDGWNIDRDNARAEMANSAYPAGQNAGPAWSDLNFYGSWYNLPGQGMAWAPDGVGEDFDPYGSGAWGYYNTVGYGWVSSYPWGWLPYHCGLWNYYPGNGWMWLPSHCGWGAGGGYGWYPYSEIRNAPHLYRRPQPPHGARPVRPSQALVAVSRGSAVHFRGVGEPRPVARALVVSGATLQPVPVEMRPSYRSVAPGGTNTAGFAGGSQPLSGTQSYVTGSRFVGGAAGTASASHIMLTPRPQAATPAPQHMSAPPAPSAPVSAPHMSAPAASSSGHGH